MLTAAQLPAHGFHESGPHTLNVELLSVNDNTPAEIVAWFASAWGRLDCTYRTATSR